MQFGGGTETRMYNPLGQLTGIAGGSANVNIAYSFSATTNNGRAASMTFNRETVTYAYDSLNRLVQASSNQGWVEDYGHDRYGNLTFKGGQSIGVDQSTTRLIAGFYDANGNYGAANGWEYDIENRLTKWTNNSSPDQNYGYDARNKRVWKRHVVGSSTVEHVFFYGGQARLWTYEIQWQPLGGGVYEMRLVVREANFYYGGRLLRSKTDFGASGDPGWVMMDRLGSVVPRGSTLKKYRPHGDEYSVTSNSEQKFGTYYRHDVSGLDYADQRYYHAVMGQFINPDPVEAGDTLVTYADPTGLIKCRDLRWVGGATTRELMRNAGDFSLLADLVWHEAGPMYGTDTYDTLREEHLYIGAAVMSRLDMSPGRLTGYDANGDPHRYTFLGSTLGAVILNAGGNNLSWGIFTNGRISGSDEWDLGCQSDSQRYTTVPTGVYRLGVEPQRRRTSTAESIKLNPELINLGRSSKVNGEVFFGLLAVRPRPPGRSAEVGPGGGPRPPGRGRPR
jgi:RHS repeat-associated protein